MLAPSLKGYSYPGKEGMVDGSAHSWSRINMGDQLYPVDIWKAKT